MLAISRMPANVDRALSRVMLRLPDGREVWVQVAHVYGDKKVRLAIEAPADVIVMREELIGKSRSPGASSLRHQEEVRA